jgi:hypothetical protein
MSRRKKIDEVEIDTRLATVLGLERKEFRDRDGEWIEWWERDGKEVCGGNFSPATKRDHFVECVLPEIERRGLCAEFQEHLRDRSGFFRSPDLSFAWTMLTASPVILAVAALAVLEASQ